MADCQTSGLLENHNVRMHPPSAEIQGQPRFVSMCVQSSTLFDLVHLNLTLAYFTVLVKYHGACSFDGLQVIRFWSRSYTNDGF